MTDPDDNFIFPPGMPDEDKEKFKRLMTERHDHHMVFKHQVSNFFQGLNEEQLSTLRDIFAGIGKKNIGALDYYQGVMTMMLVDKFDYCLACGNKHDEELQRMMEQMGDFLAEQAGEQAAADKAPDSVPGSEGENLSTQGPDAEILWRDALADKELHAKMDLYRLNGIAPYPRVICRDCGMQYPSLEDRMMNAPDHCSGCFQKSAHG